MGKRLRKAAWMTAGMVCIWCFCLLCFAGEALAALKVEQVYINAPAVQTYITGGDKSLPKGIEPEMDFEGTALEYAGDAHLYDSEKDGGTEVIYVAEISKYVTKKQRKSIVSSLKQAVDRKKEKDVLTVYTFGDKFSSEPLLQLGQGAGSDEKKEGKKKLDKIFRMKEKTSHLWNAVINVAGHIDKSDGTGPNRRAAIFITGGNYKKSTSNNDKEDVKKKLAAISKNAAFYMIQLKTKSKIDGSEASVFTENGGEKYSEKSEKNVVNCFKKLWDTFDNTCVVSFQASDSTVFDEGGALTLRVNGELVCENRRTGAAYSWQENPAKPVLVPMTEGGTDYIKKEDGHTISFSFSEPVKGAEVIKNYSLTRGAGIRMEIKSLKYDVKTYRCTITLEQDIFTDTYKLALSNITDIDHSPAAAEPAEVSFSMEGKNEQVYNFLQFLKSYWWIILIAVILIILLIVYLVIRSHGGIVEQEDGKKGFANATTVTVGISTPKTKKIVLMMTDSYGKTKEIICNIDSSIFVGRDKMCQIHTDDDKMSRQHFAIESTQVGFFIMDLDTLNGTSVNGTKLTARQMLKEGDVISAGREKFVFSLYKEAQ